MKKILFLALAPLLFASCSVDRYEGDERIIIEGTVLYNNIPLKEAEIDVYPVYNKPVNGTIAQIIETDVDYYNYNYISRTYTDHSGKISLSIPRNEDTNVFVVKISRGYNEYKYYGYISRYNTRGHYVNLGTITF